MMIMEIVMVMTTMKETLQLQREQPPEGLKEKRKNPTMFFKHLGNKSSPRESEAFYTEHLALGCGWETRRRDHSESLGSGGLREGMCRVS